MEDNALLYYSLSTVDNMHPKLPYSLHPLALKLHMCQQSFILMGVHFIAWAVLRGKHKCLTGVCTHAVMFAFVIPWTVAHQAPLSMEFSRQEYWSGLPLPASRNLSHLGIKPRSPALQGRFFTLSATREVLDRGQLFRKPSCNHSSFWPQAEGRGMPLRVGGSETWGWSLSRKKLTNANHLLFLEERERVWGTEMGEVGRGLCSVFAILPWNSETEHVKWVEWKEQNIRVHGCPSWGPLQARPHVGLENC